jgi:glucan 1,3-beta-glucosidase
VYHHLIIIAALILLLAGVCSAWSDQLPLLSTRDSEWVDSKGDPILLRGCNLGNWLVHETWMDAMKADGIPDQYTMEQVLARRFGSATKDRLMETYRKSYITARDFRIIKSFGMNVVRLPILYTLLEDDAHPFQLKPGAWIDIDRAVGWAEAEGIYVILDLHGAPGGQNPWQHCGRENQNGLWGSEENKRRTVWLWQQIASRYRGRGAVAAYDLLNEPYTAPKEELKELMLDIYRAIREVDPDHVIIFPALADGFEFYGKPGELGLRNVAFTAHFYPGFFGWSQPDRQVHLDWLSRGVPEWRKRVAAAGVPLLVGEMNVVLKSAGGPEMMRRSFDAYAQGGWAVTMWAYKCFSPEGGLADGSWGMVTNPPGDGAPLVKVGPWAGKGWERSFADASVRGDTRFVAPGAGSAAVYLVVKAGAGQGSVVDIAVEHISLADDTTGRDVLADGPADSAAWMTWHHAGELSADWHYATGTDSRPALRLSGKGFVNGGTYRKLSLTGGHRYTLSGRIRDIGSSPDSTWVEVYLRTDAPRQGEDYLAEPAPGSEIDLRTSSAEEIARYFRALSRMEYLIYTDLQHALQGAPERSCPQR